MQLDDWEGNRELTHDKVEDDEVDMNGAARLVDVLILGFGL